VCSVTLQTHKHVLGPPADITNYDMKVQSVNVASL